MDINQFMNEDQKAKLFGDIPQHDRACEELYELVGELTQFPSANQHERHYILAAIRRTLSLNMAFRQAIESQNGQMAATLIRLNLDTLARTYALYWADETADMSAETFSKAIYDGQSIRNMNLRGAIEKATDRWLINQITALGDWITKVYKETSGAIHFSDFHIKQLLQQASITEEFTNGSAQVEYVISPVEIDIDPEHYRELMQAFLHITMMFVCAIQHRVEIVNGSRSL